MLHRFFFACRNFVITVDLKNRLTESVCSLAGRGVRYGLAGEN